MTGIIFQRAFSRVFCAAIAVATSAFAAPSWAATEKEQQAQMALEALPEFAGIAVKMVSQGTTGVTAKVGTKLFPVLMFKVGTKDAPVWLAALKPPNLSFSAAYGEGSGPLKDMTVADTAIVVAPADTTLPVKDLADSIKNIVLGHMPPQTEEVTFAKGANFYTTATPAAEAVQFAALGDLGVALGPVPMNGTVGGDVLRFLASGEVQAENLTPLGLQLALPGMAPEAPAGMKGAFKTDAVRFTFDCDAANENRIRMTAKTNASVTIQKKVLNFASDVTLDPAAAADAAILTLTGKSSDPLPPLTDFSAFIIKDFGLRVTVTNKGGPRETEVAIADSSTFVGNPFPYAAVITGQSNGATTYFMRLDGKIPFHQLVALDSLKGIEGLDKVFVENVKVSGNSLEGSINLRGRNLPVAVFTLDVGGKMKLFAAFAPKGFAFNDYIHDAHISGMQDLKVDHAAIIVADGDTAIKPAEISKNVAAVFDGLKLKSDETLTVKQGVNLYSKVDFGTKGVHEVLRKVLGVTSISDRPLRGTLHPVFLSALALKNKKSHGGFELKTTIPGIKPPKLDKYIRSKGDMEISFTREDRKPIQYTGKTDLAMTFGKAKDTVAATIRFNDNPGAKGNFAEITAEKVSANIPLITYDGFKADALKLDAAVNSAKQFFTGFNGGGEINGETVTFSARAPPPDAKDGMKFALTLNETLKAPALAGGDVKNLQAFKEFEFKNIVLRDHGATAVTTMFSAETPVEVFKAPSMENYAFALLPEAFSWDSLIPGIKRIPLHSAKVTDAVLVVAPLGAIKFENSKNRNQYTLVDDLPAPIKARIEKIPNAKEEVDGKSIWLNLTDGLNLFTRVDVAGSKHMKALFDLTGLKEREIGLKGRVSPNVFWVLPQKVGAQPKEDKKVHQEIIKTLEVVTTLPGLKIKVDGLDQLFEVDEGTFTVKGQPVFDRMNAGTDTGDVEIASTFSSPSRFKIPSPFKGQPPLKTFKIETKINVHKGIEDDSFEFKVEGSTEIDWKQAFGIPFFNLNNIGLDFTINKAKKEKDEKTKKVKAGALTLVGGVSSEVEVGSAKIKTVGQLVFENGKFHDLVFQAPNAVQLAKLPGLGHVPFINELEVENMSLSLAGAFTGMTVKWPRMGVHGQAGVMTIEKTTVLMVRASALELKKIAPMPDVFNIKFPQALFAISAQPGGKGDLGKFELTNLPDAARQMLAGIIDNPGDEVPIRDGLNLLGAVTKEYIPAALRKPLNEKFGVFDAIDGPLIVAGAIDGLLVGKPKIGLYAQLPGFKFPKGQPWERVISFDKVGTSFFFDLNLATTIFRAGIQGKSTVSIPHLNNPRKVDQLTFAGEAYMNLDLVTFVPAIKFAGYMNGEWRKPMGINDNFTMINPTFLIGVDTDGSVEFGVGASANWKVRGGKKDLRFDVDFVTNINFASSIPLPKKLGLVYKASEISLLTRLEIEEAMLRGVLTGPMADVAMEALIDPNAKKAARDLQEQLRKTSLIDLMQLDKLPIPNVVFSNVNLFFATPGAVIPGREDTLDTIGLRAGGEMRIDMLGETHRLGAVDYRLTLTDGIIMKADIEPRSLGPLKLKNAKIDVQANIRSLPHFKIRGDVDLLGLTETLDINLSKDKIAFFYDKNMGPLLKVHVNARTEGEDLFRAKDFVVEASIKAGLHDLLIEAVNSNMPIPPLVKDIVKTANAMTPLYISGAAFRGSLSEFIQGKPLTLALDHRIFGEKMEPAVAHVKPAWNVSSPLEAFLTVAVTLALGNSFLNYLERHPVDVSKVIPKVGPLKLEEASLRVERNTVRGHAREFVIRGKSELLGATRDTALRFYNTGMVIEEDIAVAQLWNSHLYGEVLTPRLGLIDDIRYNGEFKADFYSWLKKSVGGALDSHFKKVGSGLAVAQKKLDEAKNKVGEINRHIERARQHAINEREQVLRPLRDAESAVRSANNDVDYARRRAEAEADWVDDNCCGWGTNWFKVGAHKAAEAFWWATYGVAKAALWTAEKFLEGLRRTIEIIPIDLHPVVVFWNGVKVTALGALEIAKGAVSFVQVVNNTVADAVNKLINVVAGAKILVVNKAVFWGSFASGDLNVDLNFDLFSWRNLELNGLRVNLKDPTRTDLTGLAMAAFKIIKKEENILQPASRLPALAARMVQPSNLEFTEASVRAVKETELKVLATIQELRQKQAEAVIAALERKSALTPEEIAERIRRIDALARLELPKKYYYPGDEVVARFAASKTYEKNAWVGMMPGDVSHGDVKVNTFSRKKYEHLNKRRGGTFKFTAPKEYGQYSVRLNTGEERGREVRSVDFVVERRPVAQALKLSVPPGGAIDARFVAPKRYPHDAWFGIVPANTPHGREATNEAANKGLVYTKGRVEDVIKLTVPQELGAYDLRLNDNDKNGKETAFAGFRVELQPKILLRKIGFVTGEDIKVGFEAPWSYPKNAWIGLVPSGVPHGNETANDARDVARADMNSQSRGDFTLKAPDQPGKYDVRMHTNDNGGDEVYSLTVSVEEVSIAIKKTEFVPGEDIAIDFKAPAFYPGTAWIGIYPADAPRNELGQKDKRILSYDLTRLKTSGTLTFPAPAKPGHYEVRFNDDGGNGEDGNPKGNEGKGGREVKVLKFAVEPVAVSSLKQDFIPGETVTVDYVAPSWYPATAWVALVPTNTPKQTRGINEPANKEHHALPVTADDRARRTAETDPEKRARRGRLSFTAPEPGVYDLRLNDDGGNGEDGKFTGFQGRGGGKEIRIAQIRVEPVGLVPRKLAFIPREKIKVGFTSPSFYSDDSFISLVRKGAPAVAGGHADQAVIEYHTMKGDRGRASNPDPVKRHAKANWNSPPPNPEPTSCGSMTTAATATMEHSRVSAVRPAARTSAWQPLPSSRRT